MYESFLGWPRYSDSVPVLGVVIGSVIGLSLLESYHSWRSQKKNPTQPQQPRGS